MAIDDALRSLDPSGPQGFEGLIQQLFSSLTGYQFYLARSGSQAGRDLATSRFGTVMAVECKRYGRERELDQTELLGKLTEAATTIPELDVWALAASRDVPEQLYSALQRAARRFDVDVHIVSAADSTPSSLEALCAHAPDVVIRHLQAAHLPTAGLRSELRRLAEHSAFANRLEALRRALSKDAGYGALRERTKELLLRQLASETESRTAFGQLLDIEDQARRGRLVLRPSAMKAIETWLSGWHSDHRFLAVLGEEGDGKTWAVASWLHAHLTSAEAFPPVVWIPSKDGTTDQLEALITRSLARRLGGETERWTTRVRRWCKDWPGDVPALLLVIDGLNEQHDASWWRPILEEAASSPWRESCGLIMTARTGFWTPLQRLRHLECETYTVEPFSEPELEKALSQVGLRRGDFDPGVLALVRKPRYFDLAVRFREQLAASGDLTVARLIYEDWRDRLSRRAVPLDDDAFRALISDLAAKQRLHANAIPRSEIDEAFAHIEERQAAIRELESGGILIPDGRALRVDPKRLALGLGLVLAAELKDSFGSVPLEERIAHWLEPHSDMDVKGAIVESAVVHAMVSPDHKTTSRSALLTAWLTHRHVQAPSPSRVAAYLPNDPDAYFSAAESIWGDVVDDGGAQRALKSAFLRWRNVDALRPSFRKWLHRWLTFVHVDGSPVAVGPEDRPERRRKLEAALGRPVPIGSFGYARRTFVGVDDEGLLRLGRLALGLIGEGDRAPYAESIADAYIADVLMQYPDKSELLEWVIRTSNGSLGPKLLRLAASMASLGDTAVLQAAYRLADSLGTEAATLLRLSLPSDLFPKSELWSQYEADPCGSGFAWRIENCAKCIGRSDLPAHLLADQVARCAANPDIAIPAETCSKVSELLRDFQPENLWSGPWLTEIEHRFDTIEPTLARCDIPRWAKIVRSAATSVQDRSGLALRQLAFQLTGYGLLLSRVERTAIEGAWQRLLDAWPSLDREDQRAEAVLFELMLSGLSAEEQLELLLRRPPSAQLFIRFRGHFKPIEWRFVQTILETGDPRAQTVALFFVASHDPIYGGAGDQTVRSLVSSSDAHLRALALETIWRAGDVTDVKAVATSDWHVRQDESSYWENHWGSVILAEHSDLPYEELRSRIQLRYIGRVIERRGADPVEVEKYAQDIDRIWTRILGIETAIEPLAIQLAIPREDRNAIDLPGLAQSSFSRSATFIARHASWGGQLNASPDPSLFGGPSDEELEGLHAALSAALVEQRAAGNEWFGRRFDRSGLVAVINARPDLVKKWTNPTSSDRRTWTRRLFLARSFYETLCEVLLSVTPEVGAALLTVLKSEDSGIRIVDRLTGIAHLDYALFDTSASVEVEDLWARRRDSAQSDRDLLELVILCRGKDARDWLRRSISDDCESEVPLRRARSILLTGLLGLPVEQTDRVPLPSHILAWESEMKSRADLWRNRARWAAHWLDRFVSAEPDEEANAAFRLFLRCVDSRYAVSAGAILGMAASHRQAFFRGHARDIERAIKDNEKDLREHFLGRKVVSGEIWPWFATH